MVRQASNWVNHAAATLCAVCCLTAVAAAAPRYDPVASDTEMKIGQTMAYSGPASAYATIGRAEAPYFAKVSAEGGVNGRRIKLVSLDDGYGPPKTVEQPRRLVEQEGVLLLFSSLGTDPNAVVHAYLNARKETLPHPFRCRKGKPFPRRISALFFESCRVAREAL